MTTNLIKFNLFCSQQSSSQPTVVPPPSHQHQQQVNFMIIYCNKNNTEARGRPLTYPGFAGKPGISGSIICLFFFKSVHFSPNITRFHLFSVFLPISGASPAEGFYQNCWECTQCADNSRNPYLTVLGVNISICKSQAKHSSGF